MNQTEFDIIIIGGGMVGASLAVALKKLPCRIALIESVASDTRLQSHFDARSFALSYGSARIFSAMGLWTELEKSVVPIEQIHVSDRGHFGRSHFSAEKTGVDALGYVIEAQDINAVLHQECAQMPNLTQYCPARVMQLAREDNLSIVAFEQDGQTHHIRAPLVVAADGGNSTVRKLCGFSSRQYDYRQTAIVANIGLSRDHHNIAYERFTADGPLAMLPMREQRSALVWSIKPELAEAKMALGDEAFLHDLQTAFGYRLGKLQKVGQRYSFPLKLTISDQVIAPGVVLIGNASQALHPIAGQGFNLGLRDVATLAQIIRDASMQNQLNDFEYLEKYLAWRKRDQQKTILFCDFVPRVFSNDWRPLSIARDMGLCAVDTIKPIKDLFLQQNMGLLGKSPDLLCGVPL